MPDMWMDVDTALSEVPVNILALTDDTTFKDREEAVVYNQAGLDLVWNFITTAGAFTQTAVTPTDAGLHDWVNKGNGMYAIEIPASGGTINNDTEGFGWFTGIATGILHWRGPIIGFRAAGLNNALIDGGDLLDVNVTHVAETAQTGNDNGADINTILARIVGTLAAGTHNPQTGDSFARIGATGSGLTSLAQASAYTAARAAYLDQLDFALQEAIDAIPTTPMRGTDNAALASVCTEVRLAELAAGNLPDNIDTLLARITANVALASVCTETRLAELAAGNIPDDIDTLLTRISEALSFTGGNVHVHVKAEDNIDFGALKKTSINDQVADVVKTDTAGEPGQEAYPEVASMEYKVAALYKEMTNEHETTNTEIRTKNRAGAVVDQKRSHVDSGGTYTKGVIGSGP